MKYTPKFCQMKDIWKTFIKIYDKHSAWKILLKFKFCFKWNAPKVYSFGPFWDPITAGKPKILLKTKISAKTASLEIYSNVSPSSQIIHRILVKLSKKPFFGPKLGVNCPNEAVPKGITNSHKAYNRTTDIYFLDVTFQPLGFRL